MSDKAKKNAAAHALRSPLFRARIRRSAKTYSRKKRVDLAQDPV